MDPIIYVMIVAAILSFVANEPLDALAIIFIILVDAVMSTIQEYKATKNAEALKELIKVKAKVIRDNEYIEIDSSLLVPGDIIVLESGTKISADARIINSNNLTIDESILTGESIGVLKEEGEAILSDVSKKNMLYAGTSVLTGRALAVVCGTGLDTEVGKIAEKVTTTEESKSPLTIRTEKFSKQITMLIVIISIIIAIVLIYKKYEPIEIFLSVVALGVSAMPEGLPLSLTLALTIASNKMGKRNVIVKKLNSVESLGSCTVIASDKTGTLTVNEQTAKKVVLPNGEKFDIEGNGYNDVGKIIFDAGSELKNAKYLSILGLVNNEAMLEKNKGKWDKFGDSIDIAFLALSRKLKTNDTEFKKVDVIPYESLKKYSAVFFKMDDKMYCTAKGSVEVILDFCSYSMVDGVKKKIDKEKILKQNDELASSGYRVIALCSKEIKEKEIERKQRYEEIDEEIRSNVSSECAKELLDEEEEKIADEVKESNDFLAINDLSVTSTATRNPKVSLFTKLRTKDEHGAMHCDMCGEFTSFDTRNFETHHIIPLSAGGIDNIYNTVCLCGNCHNRMHSKFPPTMYEMGKLLEKVRERIKSTTPYYLQKFDRLFNPNYNALYGDDDYDKESLYYENNKEREDRNFLVEWNSRR